MDRATRLGGSPHLSCKRDQIKMRDYMDRRVTPSKRVISPAWGPPPPCKQALTGQILAHYSSSKIRNTHFSLFRPVKDHILYNKESFAFSPG